MGSEIASNVDVRHERAVQPGHVDLVVNGRVVVDDLDLRDAGGIRVDDRAAGVEPGELRVEARRRASQRNGRQPQ
jgi:hypothetical protein